MLFNEQEMIALCNEMGIELIDNDGCIDFPTVDNSLFNLSNQTRKGVKTMKTIITQDRLTKEERECVIVYSEIDDRWHADVSVAKLRTKFVKQGWVQTSETTLPDGTWVASTFEAPYHSVGIKGMNKRVRNMTDEQRKELSERAKARFGK